MSSQTVIATVIARKKRGPAPTGKGTQIVTRMQPDQLGRLDAWIEKQADEMSRPEAVRRLVDKALGFPSPAESARASKPRKATKAAPPKKTRQRRG